MDMGFIITIIFFIIIISAIVSMFSLSDKNIREGFDIAKGRKFQVKFDEEKKSRKSGIQRVKENSEKAFNTPEFREHPILKKDNFESKALAIAITVFMVMALIGMLVMTYSKRNPIIGKWKSEISMPFMGKMIDDVEFTSNSVYMSGMKFSADYEIDGNRVILHDDSGIGLVYEIIDDHTMRTNTMGIETIYKKID